MLKELINKLQQNPFFKNVLILATGTGLAQIIPIFTSPINRRLYTPEEYGQLGLIVSISAICASIATGRYEMAIMLPKKLRKAISLVWLSFSISTAFSLLLLFLVVFFKGIFAQWLNNPEIENWLFLVPFIVFGNSVYKILYNYNNKLKSYKIIARTQLTRAIIAAGIMIGLGLAIKGSEIGLMVATVISTYAGITLLAKAFKKDSRADQSISKEDMLLVAKDYNKFPKYSVWAGLANVASNHLLSIFIFIAFGKALLGQFSLTNVICGIPTTILGLALSQVYYQRIIEVKNNGGDTRKMFLKTIKMIAIVSLTLFFILYFIAGPAIKFVYGSNWDIAAELTTIMIPFFAIRFISSSVGTTTSAFERQELTLVVNVCLLITLAGLIGIIKIWELSIFESVGLYASSFSVLYLIFIFVFYRIINRYERNKINLDA